MNRKNLPFLMALCLIVLYYIGVPLGTIHNPCVDFFALSLYVPVPAPACVTYTPQAGLVVAYLP